MPVFAVTLHGKSDPLLIEAADHHVKADGALVFTDAGRMVAIIPPGWQAVVDASAVRTAQVAPAPMKHG